jgi:hypothetical protein
MAAVAGRDPPAAVYNRSRYRPQVAAGIDDNQAALLRVAKESSLAAQLAVSVQHCTCHLIRVCPTG